jgi:DNA-binding MarR family transcriptional regulator
MLSRVISRLAAMRLIDRVRHQEDLRSASVIATPAGRQLSGQIKERRAAAVSRCLDLLPPAQVAALSSALPALEELAETMRQVGRADHVRDEAG